MVGVSVLHIGEEILTVAIAGEPMALHSMWLRDSCACATCRRPTSNERLFESSDIPTDLTVVDARLEDDELRLDTSDGHDVRIPTAWLVTHLAASDRHDEPAHGRTMWTGAGDDSQVPHEYSLESIGRSREWLDAVHEIGVVKITGDRHGEETIRRVAESIGPIRPTNYGVIWTVEATVDPATAVDSERSLRVHTDLPYLDNPPGVQLMMVDNGGVEGGDSTFVDGFAVAEHIRATDPDAWRLLTTTEFAYPFVRHGIEMYGRAPLIEVRRNGEYAMIRRAPDLVGASFVSAPNVRGLYRALRLWNGLLDGGGYEIRVRVDAGDVVVWDNHRLLHGRTGFELGSDGRRILLGCYVDADHLRNRRALIARGHQGGASG